VVVSTRSKHGTTWVQWICTMLVRGTSEIPGRLVDESPWLDWLAVPLDEVLENLERQTYRRVIKTHTPLDGLPVDERVTYVVAARHPLDAAVSLYHQGNNIDRARLAAGTGNPSPTVGAVRPPLREWLSAWIAAPSSADQGLDSLEGVAHHLGDAWARRGADNVVLVHFDDLLRDLPGQIARLGEALGVTSEQDAVGGFARAAEFGAMRRRSDHLAPDPIGVLRDRAHFFREGRSGAGVEFVDAVDLDAYHQRMQDLLEPDLLQWRHRYPGGGGRRT